jgi:hypothetical protein
MKDRVHETPITPDLTYSEQALSDHTNFAVITLPPEFGDAQAIQAQAINSLANDEFIQKGWDSGFEPVKLEGLEADASAAVDGDLTYEPLVRYYASLAKSWGFSDNASLGVMFQSDKDKNPNVTIHRDGVGANSSVALDDGKEVRAVRFVYPIGRPGTILYPDMDLEGQAINWKNEVIEDPTEEDHVKSPHFMSAEGEEKQRLIDEASAVQVMPGATLVFDMTRSPWHVAPDKTPGGAIMTVDVYEAW